MKYQLMKDSRINQQYRLLTSSENTSEYKHIVIAMYNYSIDLVTIMMCLSFFTRIKRYKFPEKNEKKGLCFTQ